MRKIMIHIGERGELATKAIIADDCKHDTEIIKAVTIEASGEDRGMLGNQYEHVILPVDEFFVAIKEYIERHPERKQSETPIITRASKEPMVDWHDVAKLQDRVMILEHRGAIVSNEIDKIKKTISDIGIIVGKESNDNGCIFKNLDERLGNAENRIDNFQYLIEQNQSLMRRVNALEKDAPERIHSNEIFSFNGNFVVCGEEMAFVNSDSSINKQFVEFANKHKNKRVRVYYEVLDV